MTAIDIGATHPILPFAIMPRFCRGNFADEVTMNSLYRTINMFLVAVLLYTSRHQRLKQTCLN